MRAKGGTRPQLCWRHPREDPLCSAPQVWTLLSNSIMLRQKQPLARPSRASSYNYALTEVTTRQTRQTWLLCRKPAGSAGWPWPGLTCFTSAQPAQRHSEGTASLILPLH